MVISLCIRIYHYEYALWNVSNHTAGAFDLLERSCTIAYKKRKMRLVPKNKWWQFKIHSINPKWRMMTRMWCRRPEGKSVVYSIWIYKIQHVVYGNIVGYMARFIARGFSQKEGIDYEKTFAPIACWNIVTSKNILYVSFFCGPRWSYRENHLY